VTTVPQRALLAVDELTRNSPGGRLASGNDVPCVPFYGEDL